MKASRLAEYPAFPSAETEHDRASAHWTMQMAQPSDYHIRTTFPDYGTYLAEQDSLQLLDCGSGSQEPMIQLYRQHELTALNTPRMPIPEPAYGDEQIVVLPVSWIPQHGDSSYGGGLRQSLAHQEHQNCSVESYVHGALEADTTCDFSSIPQRLRRSAMGNISASAVKPTHSVQDQNSSQVLNSDSDTLNMCPLPDRSKLAYQGLHHHQLPNHPTYLTQLRTGNSQGVARLDEHGAPSVVGLPGMPKPAMRPKKPKSKFLPREDALLVHLKEMEKSLTWKQIAHFFPGRSSGTLQVRYCTKLKARKTRWTEAMVRVSCLRYSSNKDIEYSLTLRSYRSTVCTRLSMNMSTIAGA